MTLTMQSVSNPIPLRKFLASSAVCFGRLAIVAMDSQQELNWDPKAEKVLGNLGLTIRPRLGARIKV